MPLLKKMYPIIVRAGVIAALLASNAYSIPQMSKMLGRRAFMTIGPATAFAAGGSQLELELPDGTKHAIKRRGERFEIPSAFAQKNGFKFVIQMRRRDIAIMPCEFTVEGLSDFNRRLICRTYETNDATSNQSAKQAVHESVEVRVYTEVAR